MPIVIYGGLLIIVSVIVACTPDTNGENIDASGQEKQQSEMFDDFSVKFTDK